METNLKFVYGPFKPVLSSGSHPADVAISSGENLVPDQAQYRGIIQGTAGVIFSDFRFNQTTL